MPLEQMRTEADMMRDRESRFGKFKGSAAVGAIPRDAETVRAFVRLDFEKRSVYNVYLWGPQRILGLRGTPELPPLRYLPTSDRDFASFSLEGGGIERRLRCRPRRTAAARPRTARRARGGDENPIPQDSNTLNSASPHFCPAVTAAFSGSSS